MSSERMVSTRRGPARLVTHPARQPSATLVLQHGAGGGIDSADLLALAEHLPAQGITVVRFEQPWRVVGRKVATPPATLDEALRAVVADLELDTPLVLGGRSAGARSSVRCAQELAAVACLALAFPLHPPGRPEKSRLAELHAAGVPTLVIQGERDPMGRPEEFPSDVDLAVVPAADHGFAVPASSGLSAEVVLGIIVEATLEWLTREVTGAGTPPEG